MLSDTFLAEVRKAMCWTDEQETQWLEVEADIVKAALSAAKRADNDKDVGQAAEDAGAEEDDQDVEMEPQDELNDAASTLHFNETGAHSNADDSHWNETPAHYNDDAPTIAALQHARKTTQATGGRPKSAKRKPGNPRSNKQQMALATDDALAASTCERIDDKECDDDGPLVGQHPGSAYIAPSTNMSKEELTGNLLAEVELEKWRGHFRGGHVSRRRPCP
jgi:hypothetical protein